MNLLKLLSNRDYGLYNKTLAKEIGLHESILLSELCAEYDYWESQNLLDNGWFFSTADNIYQNTSLSAYQQRTAFSKLEELGVIETSFRGVPAKKYFKLDANNIESLLINMSKPSFKETEELDVKKSDTNNNNNNKNNNNNNNYSSNSKSDADTVSDKSDNDSNKELTEQQNQKSVKTYAESSKHYNAIKQYIDTLSYSTETKDVLWKWYNNIGKGRVSVKQLKDKLKTICDATNGNEVLIRTSIDNAYLNGWFGFFYNNSNKTNNMNTGFNKFNEPTEANKPVSTNVSIERPKLSSKTF